MADDKVMNYARWVAFLTEYLGRLPEGQKKDIFQYFYDSEFSKWTSLTQN